MLAFVKELLGIGEFFHTLARQLSLGQKMRADIALMLLHEPEILFLDEPTIGLDVLAKRNILDFIKTLNRERGVTVLLTSHDMDELEQLAGRIVLIDRGRIAYDGDFVELRRRYGDRRHLTIETAAAAAPRLDGVRFTGSEGNRHHYTFDAARTPITALLQQASAQTAIHDVGNPPLPHRRRDRRHLPALEHRGKMKKRPRECCSRGRCHCPIGVTRLGIGCGPGSVAHLLLQVLVDPHPAGRLQPRVGARDVGLAVVVLNPRPPEAALRPGVG